MRVFFSEHYVATSHSIDATKKPLWIAESLHKHPISGVTVENPLPANRRQLERVHDTSYVDAVMTGQPRELAESSTFPWDDGVWLGEVASCGGMIAACERALDEGVAGSLSCGFHHASRARGRSHCIFNGLAVAIFALRDRGVERLLYIDLDAHCGGGVYALAGKLTGYRQLDVSLFPTDRYTPAIPSTLDLVESSDAYLSVIRDRLDDLGRQMAEFQLCVYYAGMDPHEGSAFGGLPGIDAQMLRSETHWCFPLFENITFPVRLQLAEDTWAPDLIGRVLCLCIEVLSRLRLLSNAGDSPVEEEVNLQDSDLGLLSAPHADRFGIALANGEVTVFELY